MHELAERGLQRLTRSTKSLPMKTRSQREVMRSTPCGRCLHFSDDACDADLLGGEGICLMEGGPVMVSRQTDVGCRYYQDLIGRPRTAEPVLLGITRQGASQPPFPVQ